MNFVSWAALGVAALVAGPVVAHLLRKGQTPVSQFPAVALVPNLVAHSRQAARLKDRSLLLIRACTVLALALLGATPLVQCSDLALQRAQGESIALAIVLDDSHSMRAVAPGATSRWEAARSGALQLLSSMTGGDSIAVVLAGSPARLALAPTLDVRSAEKAIRQLTHSDRPSDVAGAVRLAEAALANQRQPSRQIVLFSDLTGEGLPAVVSEGIELQLPLEQLREPVNDCGFVGARRTSASLELQVACSPSAKTPRSISAVTTDGMAPVASPPPAFGQLLITPKPGLQTVKISIAESTPLFDVQLTPADENPSNDWAAVSEEAEGIAIAVVADADQPDLVTGGATLLERAVRALEPTASVRPLTELPDDALRLKPFAAVLVDDPTGLSPDQRAALTQWLNSGGVAVGMLGPALGNLALAASPEPFADGSARWTNLTQSIGIFPESVAVLGAHAQSLKSLTPKGRAHLEGSLLPNSRVLGTWQDGTPFLVHRAVGAGLVVTVGLSTALQESNFALRPGFLSLLANVLREAKQRWGSSSSTVGETWVFSGGEPVLIEGPEGPLPTESMTCGPSEPCSELASMVRPTRSGRYRIAQNGRTRSRIAFLDPREIAEGPRMTEVKQSNLASTTGAAGAVDASSQAAFLLLLLFGLELSIRARRHWTRSTRRS